MQIEFKYQAGQTFVEETAIMIKEAVYKGGIELILIPIEGNTLKEHLQKHDFDMYMSAWAGGSLPEEFTQLWHTKSYSTGGSNYVGFGNSETDALIDQIKVTMDSEKRIPLSQKMQQIIYDEQPYIFMYSAYRKNIIHKRFGNQIMTFDRPGNILNNLRLIALYGAQSGSVTNATESNQ
jgi:ABC-type transport system substrate-binding protein